MSIQLCGKRVDFYFPPHKTSLAPTSHAPFAPHIHSFRHTMVFRIDVSDGDESPHMWSIALSDLHLLTPTSLGVTSACTGEVVYTVPPFHISTTPPPLSLLSTA